ncbi:MAG: DNA-directed RNA polymerase subunit omega [Candidatus Omnitrophica bacterium]|nr:DNA-directed RNA polymerase subunit omega [Candidatus Omnitrophota bacterium]
MINIPIEELSKQTGSIYKLVVLAARRAAELNEGAAPLVQVSSKKVATIALEEIRQGLVTYKQKGK